MRCRLTRPVGRQKGWTLAEVLVVIVVVGLVLTFLYLVVPRMISAGKENKVRAEEVASQSLQLAVDDTRTETATGSQASSESKRITKLVITIEAPDGIDPEEAINNLGFALPHIAEEIKSGAEPVKSEFLDPFCLINWSVD